MDLLHAKLTIFSSEQTIMQIPTVTQHKHDDDVSIADPISIGIINHHNDGEVVHAVLVDGNLVTQQYISDLEDEEVDDDNGGDDAVVGNDDVDGVDNGGENDYNGGDDAVDDDDAVDVEVDNGGGDDDNGGDDAVDEVVDVDNGGDNDDNGGDDVVDEAVDDDVENRGGFGENINVVTPKKQMSLVWKKGADKKPKKKIVKVKAHLRSAKNSGEKGPTKKQSKLKFPIVKSPDRSMAISMDYHHKRDYVKNFYAYQVELYNQMKNVEN